MKLFLTSSTITPELISDFELFSGKPINSIEAAFIPDAGYTPQIEDKTWIENEYLELVNDLNWKVDLFPLESKTHQELDMLFNYDVIYVNGGFSGYLAQIMRKSGFDKLLPALLKSNVIYVGSSAGSMVLSEIQDASSWYIGEPEPEAIDIPGLGYIDFQIYPHYRDELYTPIVANINPDIDYLLLRDGQAVQINDNAIKYLGSNIIALEKGERVIINQTKN